VRLDLGGIASLDTAGAWVLARACGRFRDAGLDYRLSDIPKDRQALLDEVADNIDALQSGQDDRRERSRLFDAIAVIGAINAFTTEGLLEFRHFVNEARLLVDDLNQVAEQLREGGAVDVLLDGDGAEFTPETGQ
jgi:hypothetical protein